MKRQFYVYVSTIVTFIEPVPYSTSVISEKAKKKTDVFSDGYCKTVNASSLSGDAKLELLDAIRAKICRHELKPESTHNCYCVDGQAEVCGIPINYKTSFQFGRENDNIIAQNIPEGTLLTWAFISVEHGILNSDEYQWEYDDRRIFDSLM